MLCQPTVQKKHASVWISHHVSSCKPQSMCCTASQVASMSCHVLSSYTALIALLATLRPLLGNSASTFHSIPLCPGSTGSCCTYGHFAGFCFGCREQFHSEAMPLLLLCRMHWSFHQEKMMKNILPSNPLAIMVLMMTKVSFTSPCVLTLG